MNKQKMIADLKQNFMIKRLKAQEECENFIFELRKNEEFDELYSNLIKKQLNYAKTEILEESIKLKHDIDDLKLKINNFLALKNIEQSKLKPKYDCLICNDTGVAGGKICSCLLKELNMKISMKASSQNEFKTFKQCDETIMDDNDKKACSVLKTWCEKFPNVTKTNINIIGGSGCGKTFFLESVASEMIKQGFQVCYKTAFELNELARQYHIGKSYDFVDCMNADILLIDDLGTEPVLKNVTKEYLYNLINSRQINNKPTLISTNLTFDNIIDRYDERIFSRLANKNLSINIQLNINDKRMK